MSEDSDYDQDFPEINWEQVIECSETTYDPNPLAKGWVLIHGPNIPALNELKKKVTVNTPPQSNKRSIEFVSEPAQTPATKVMTTSTKPPLNDLAMEEMEESRTATQIDWMDHRTGLDQLASATISYTNMPITERPARILPSTATKPKVWLKYITKKQEPNISSQPAAHSRRVLPEVYQPQQTIKPVFAPSTLEPIIEAKNQYDSLSQEQKEAHDAVVSEKLNVFITGSAGTGKSVLLRSIISTLKTQNNAEHVAVTASTGLAAINIQGCTLHSFASLGVRDEPAGTCINKIKRNKTKMEAMKAARVLVIDEISMIDANVFEQVEYICRKIRADGRPFGGLQVILCGDFYQLPPVAKNSSFMYAFESDCWERVINKSIELKNPFRQKDVDFFNLLNEVRIGKISKKTGEILKSLSRRLESEHNIEPTELYPRKAEVDSANSSRLTNLPGEVHEFKALDNGKASHLANCIAPELLTLKVGAQVMLLKKLGPNLMNGSIGTVVSFRTTEKYDELPVVQFNNGERRVVGMDSWTTEAQGKITSRRRQIPLTLAWALTIHKSQGQTIDWLKVDLAKIFEIGQTYVAFSRAVSQDSIQVLNFNPMLLGTNAKVSNFYKKKILKSNKKTPF